jgi:hypothetical protein
MKQSLEKLVGVQAVSEVGVALPQALDQAGAASATKIEAAVATTTKMQTVAFTTARGEAEAASTREVEVGVAPAQAVDQVVADVPTKVYVNSCLFHLLMSVEISPEEVTPLPGSLF